MKDIIIIKVIGTIMAFVNPNTPFIGMMVFSNIIKTILAKTNIKETIIPPKKIVVKTHE